MLPISFLLGRHGKGGLRVSASRHDAFRSHRSRRGDSRQTGFARGGFETRPYDDIAVIPVRRAGGCVRFMTPWVGTAQASSYVRSISVRAQTRLQYPE
jgi:hypothetical protein